MNLKKEILIALMGMVSLASAQEVVTLGTFGFQKVDIPPAGGLNLVGFSFSSSSFDPIYLEDAFGSDQLTQGFLPTLADRIYIWDGTQYDAFFQKADGLFYNTLAPSTPVQVEVFPGMAMFIQSPVSAVATNTISLSGSVLLDDFSEQAYGGLVTIANPYPTELDYNGTNVDWSAATSGFLPTLADRVYVWNPGTSTYESFFLKNDLKWYDALSPTTLGDVVVPNGGGAFYEAKSDFTNNIVRPFSL